MIREARIEDLKKLQTLHNKVSLDIKKLGDSTYEAEIQKKGFLLNTDNAHEMQEEFTEAYKFLVDEENEKIIGYLIADHRDKQKFYDDEYKTWFDLEMKSKYYSDPKGMTIATIAVDPEYGKKGVATSLLNHLEKILKEEEFNYLFSIVVLAPVTNCPSIVWHTRNGFKRLAMGRPRRLFELDNFSSVLIYKKID